MLRGDRSFGMARHWHPVLLMVPQRLEVITDLAVIEQLMSDRATENMFLRLRCPQTDGKPVCPPCGCQIHYNCRRLTNQPRWRGKGRADFPVTSGTLFAWHKLSLKSYLRPLQCSVGVDGPTESRAGLEL
jgi:hypothetical protein